MPDKSLLTEQKKTISITYAGEQITFSFTPGKITPKWERKFNELIQDEWRSRAIVETLSEILVDWDILDNGKPFPPTAENLQLLPLDLLSEIFTKIMESQRPNQQSAGSFGDGSLPA
jgi:hypothetical protein